MQTEKTIIPTPEPTDSLNPLRGAGNLRRLLGWRSLAPSLFGAVAGGLLLSAAFSPLEWAWAGWLALTPLLLAPIPRRRRGRLLTGYLFGLVHFATSLSWLNEVGFKAGYLLAAVCAMFLMAWYVLFCDLVSRLSQPRQTNPSTEDAQRFWLLALPPRRFLAVTVLAPVFWVAVEWLRSWLFTGFPWNHLGLSQWQHQGLMQVTTITGVYGLSFLLVVANLVLIWIVHSRWRYWVRNEGRNSFPWPVAAGLLFFLPVLPLAWQARRPMPPPDTTIRVAAVQGNIPQIRMWSESQLKMAIDVYDRLSREAAEHKPDLLVWPETAIPAPAFYNQRYQDMLENLMRDIQTPLLFGNLHLQPVEGGNEDEYHDFNSVFLLDAQGRVKDYYHKIHLVPFGEYVPLGGVFPQLHDLIGMGRDLSAGREFTLFELAEGVWAGVNICFEDAFPRISRQFVLRGANLLMTLTNDAWFGESVGSRQHMIHATLRAAENRRPLLRSGNNSDTALILPNGEVRGLLYDQETGHRFVRDWKIYQVPVWLDADTTFYTRHGNLFAQICAGIALAWLVFRACEALHQALQRRQMITGANGI